jgi:pimeloyl-ACP methyl ester carboxylesterase
VAGGKDVSTEQALSPAEAGAAAAAEARAGTDAGAGTAVGTGAGLERATGQPATGGEVYRGGAGTPLVLLHGANMSWRAWRPVLPLLEPFHTVFAPTLPGHRGGRPLPSGPATVSTLVDVVCAQLDDAGLDTAHIVGNSLGGWVGLELARLGRARSVVALSPAGTYAAPRDARRVLRKFRLGLAMGNRPTMQRLAERPAVRRMMLRQVSEHPERYTEEQVQEIFEDAAGCSVIAELLARVAEGAGFPGFTELPCPVRLAWCGEDRTIPFRRHGRPMLNALPGADFRMLPGVGHVPMIDDPALVSRTILRFTWSVDEAEDQGVA